MNVPLTIIFCILLILCLFLIVRCVVLTNALNAYHELIINLVNDDMTRENIKVIVAAMYGIDSNEIDRRLKK